MKARGISLLCTVLAALLFAVGCGSGSDDGDIEVQTGSLSKAEFIEKADAICKAARTEFLAKYSSFVQAHKTEFSDPQKQEALLEEVLDTLLAPNVEGQIEQISALGAPNGYATQVETFLNDLQIRLGEAQDDLAGLTATATPFAKAENAAKQAGMKGCSESFS